MGKQSRRKAERERARPADDDASGRRDHGARSDAAAPRDAIARSRATQPAPRPRRRSAQRVGGPVKALWRDVFVDTEAETVTPWGDLWRAHRVAIVVLFTVALVARVLVLWQISASPYAEVTNIDSDSYLAWATEMATKSWLGDHGYYQSPLYAWYL